MQYIIEHADEIEKLLKVKTQVAEVKNIMLDNIEKVMRIFFSDFENLLAFWNSYMHLKSKCCFCFACNRHGYRMSIFSEDAGWGFGLQKLNLFRTGSCC